MQIRVALLQGEWPELDRAGNIARAERGLSAARAEQAAIFALPELWSCGYDLGRLAEGGDWDEVPAFLARESTRSPAILGGSFPERNAAMGRYANCALAYEHGRELARYRKVHLFGPLGERDHMVAGSERPTIFRIAGVRCSVAVCYDLRFPELFRPLAQAGVELIFVCAQWPIARVHHWRSLLVARAIENQCYVLGVNRLGNFGEIRFGGSSLLVDPSGTLVIDAEEREGLFVGDVDPERVQRLRREFPVLGDRRHDLYPDPLSESSRSES